MKVAATSGPEVAQDLRDGDDGGAKVEAVALIGDGGAAPARPIQPVDHRNAPTLRPKSHCRRKATQPRTNDDSLTLGGGDDGGDFVHLADDNVSTQIYNYPVDAAK